MKKLIVVLLMTLISLMSYSQTYTPNFKKIKKEVNKKKSDLYYPKLLERFESADTTLTLDQLQHFYYGAATRSNYNPYKFDDNSELIKILKKETKETKDWQKAANIIDVKLKDNPTSFRYHIYKHMIYEQLYGESSKPANDALLQLMMLFSAVTSTGDGTSMETSYYVISVADEYGVLELFGLQPAGQSLMRENGQSYDVFELADNKYGLKTLYFNITICMEKMYESLGF